MSMFRRTMFSESFAGKAAAEGMGSIAGVLSGIFVETMAAKIANDVFPNNNFMKGVVVAGGFAAGYTLQDVVTKNVCAQTIDFFRAIDELKELREQIRESRKESQNGNGK